jgi:membrane associated rhomboid family serine protease
MLIPYHDDNPTRRFPLVTIGLIIVNVIALPLSLPTSLNIFNPAEPTLAERTFVAEYGFIPRVLTNLRAGQPVKVDLYPDREEEPNPPPDRFLIIQPTVAHLVLTLLTCMFLHAGPGHLFGNILFLWIFGNNIEDRLGHVVFTCFYLLGGAGATMCHWLMTAAPDDALPMVGASGAVAVILGAYIVTYPRAKVRVFFLLFCIPLFFSVPAYIMLGLWILNELIGALLVRHGFILPVAMWAHIGGFAIGAMLMPILAAGTPEPTEDWEKEAKQAFDFTGAQPPPTSTPANNPTSSGIWWDTTQRSEFQRDPQQIWWEDKPRR